MRLPHSYLQPPRARDTANSLCTQRAHNCPLAMDYLEQYILLNIVMILGICFILAIQSVQQILMLPQDADAQQMIATPRSKNAHTSSCSASGCISTVNSKSFLVESR